MFYVYEISVIHTQVRKYTKREQQKKRDTSVWSKIIQLCFVFFVLFPYLCDVEEKRKVKEDKHFLSRPFPL